MDCPDPKKHGVPPYGCDRCGKRSHNRWEFGTSNRKGGPFCHACAAETSEEIRAEDEAFEESCVKCGRLVRSRSIAAMGNPVFGIHMPAGQIDMRLCYWCYSNGGVQPTHVSCWRCGGLGSLKVGDPELLPVTRWADPVV